MSTWRLHLTIDPNADICKKGRFLPFSASDPLPSRAWGKPLAYGVDQNGAWHSESLFSKYNGTEREWREDKELGNPTDVLPGDSIEIVVTTTQPVAEVKLSVIFARAEHAVEEQGSTPFVNANGKPACLFQYATAYAQTAGMWWRFVLPNVAAFASARRFNHFEFCVVALCKVNPGDPEYLHVGHDPEVIVDMSSE